MPNVRTVALTLLSILTFGGTLYSVVNNTYLDTSNPLLTALPHRLHATHYFASKANPLNVYFIKYTWAWTTLAFLALYFTSPPKTRTFERIAKWIVETGVWMVFTSWFFGPSLLDRLTAASGGECVLHLPSGYGLTVPTEYCYNRSSISPASHPFLFSAALLVPEAGEWQARPRLRRGHDVSGHIFLLVMSTLFLVDQVRSSFRSGVERWGNKHWLAVLATLGLVCLWLFATLVTSIYFHSPMEKITGFFFGLAGYFLIELPIFKYRSQAPSSSSNSRLS